MAQPRPSDRLDGATRQKTLCRAEPYLKDVSLPHFKYGLKRAIHQDDVPFKAVGCARSQLQNSHISHLGVTLPGTPSHWEEDSIQRSRAAARYALTVTRHS